MMRMTEKKMRKKKMMTSQRSRMMIKRETRKMKKIKEVLMNMCSSTNLN